MTTTERRIAAIAAALAHCNNPKDRALPPQLQSIVDMQAHVTGRVNAAVANQAGNVDPAGYAHTLATAPTPDDFDHQVEQLAHDHARRAVLREAQAGNISGVLDRTVATRVEEAMRPVVDRLTPTFNAAVEELTEAAVKLPAGGRVFSAEAVLNSDAGTAYHQAHHALTVIDACAAIWELEKYVDPNRLPRELHPLLPVLDVDDTEPERVNWQGKPLPTERQDSTTASLHRLRRELAGQILGSEPWDHNRTLIELARQEWSGLTLKLATSHADLRARADNIRRAWTAELEERPQRVVVR